MLSPNKIVPFFNALQNAITPAPELHFNSAFQLLIAVVLSAQCTDKCVNNVTARLWKSLHTPNDFVNLGSEKLNEAIRAVGLHNMKAKHIIALCQMLLDKHGGQVPQSREELMQLPGVGRKTANVVLNVWFHQPVIAVDTHVGRVARRCGLSIATTPEGVEADLMKITPPQFLPVAHHLLLLLGRYTCQARKPLCSQCPVATLCPSAT